MLFGIPKQFLFLKRYRMGGKVLIVARHLPSSSVIQMHVLVGLWICRIIVKILQKSCFSCLGISRVCTNARETNSRASPTSEEGAELTEGEPRRADERNTQNLEQLPKRK